MAKIIRVVRENLPPVRFIGKKYKEFGHWDEWFAHGWFDICNGVNSKTKGT